MPKKQIKVVLSGSGTLYPMHAGALHYLSDAGYEITEIAGVSGGSIIACALASGYEPGPSLNELVLSTVPGPNKLIDVSYCPLWGWGLIKGDRIENELREKLSHTFVELEIPTKVYAVNVDKQGTFFDSLYTIFGTEETPNQDVASAVRASMSIPGIFQPKEIDGHKFCDGGLVANFPLHSFGTEENVIGFHIRGNKDFDPPTSFASYMQNVMRLMLEAINRQHVSEDMWAKTVLLETDKRSIEFRYGKKEVEEMLEEGYNLAKAQLESKNVKN